MIKVMLEKGAKMPAKAHPDDAGFDLFAMEEYAVVPAGGFAKIPTGVHIEIPKGYVGLITSKSGLMSKGLTCRGTIDSNYRGAIWAVVYNHGDKDYAFYKGDKVTQLVILPYLVDELTEVEDLTETDRGNGGFGSTGK